MRPILQKSFDTCTNTHFRMSRLTCLSFTPNNVHYRSLFMGKGTRWQFSTVQVQISLDIFSVLSDSTDVVCRQKSITRLYQLYVHSVDIDHTVRVYTHNLIYTVLKSHEATKDNIHLGTYCTSKFVTFTLSHIQTISDAFAADDF